MAGARALWRANGLKEEQFGKPIIAIVNSFTQFVPGHVHLHEIGQQVKAEIEKLGCFAPSKRNSCLKLCENSSVGRARPCQGRGRGFESRFSLKQREL